MQNKLHGSQDNACSRVKSISKKRGDITRAPEKKERKKQQKKCSVDWKTTSLLWLISAHSEGNSCFVASDWLKRWWIKAFLCPFYPLSKEKSLRPKSGWKVTPLFSILFVISTCVKRKEKPVFFSWQEGKKILSIIEVYNVQSSTTLALDHYFIRRDVTPSTTSDT